MIVYFKQLESYLYRFYLKNYKFDEKYFDIPIKEVK